MGKKQEDQVWEWLRGNGAAPKGLWFKGDHAYSYARLIAQREWAETGTWIVRIVPGPWVSRTTRAHELMIRRACARAGITVIDPPLGL